MTANNLTRARSKVGVLPSIDGNMVARSWNEEYRRGRYLGDRPVKFVKEIMETLLRANLEKKRGLYVGCGTGRNYIPLARAGLDIFGIDPSDVAIGRLSERMDPSRLSCCRLEDLEEGTKYDYVIAIQSFQHGKEFEVSGYFDKARSILNDGGLLFLRVNSASTEVYHRHRRIEDGRHGGFTVNYAEGPKRGLDVHFFSRKDVLRAKLWAPREVR